MSRRMLVVDDKASMRDLLTTAFSEIGFIVAQASNGIDAIALVREQPFDILITDLKMPGEDGFAVLRAARNVCPDMKAIMITGYGTMENAVEAMRLGARDFIAKPFKISELQRKVDLILREDDQETVKAAKTWLHPSVQHMVGTSAHTRQLLKMI